MSGVYPRLYSLSTVCLLKHYNQDYLLHELRTDFTGANGVGKSIIADLFQVVFIADTRYIKFATEGVDKKERKIEYLPYESSLGYAFFNIEVELGKYLTLGAAIFSQGTNIIKPFIVTSSVHFDADQLHLHTFSSDKLIFSNNFLKPERDPYTLDELARIAPEKHNLYIHYFGTRDERGGYYSWLYKNHILPINLVKEGNLKAYAKVIQSFSKSKSLDIDSSKSLIEYLFEEDEIEINYDYRQQEQEIRKLLYQFRTTKIQINDIASKQQDLQQLKKIHGLRTEAEKALDFASYVIARQKLIQARNKFEKMDSEIAGKEDKLQDLQTRSPKLSRLVSEIETLSNNEYTILNELASNQSLFNKLQYLASEEELLRDLDTEGLMHEVPEKPSELLDKDARFYEENIEKSRTVLQRYATPKTMEQKKREQDAWLKNKLREIEDRESDLCNFLEAVKGVENNLFAQILSTPKSLTAVQQAILVHFRDILLNKPLVAKEGMRYIESTESILQLMSIKDDDNKGWWVNTGPLYEFVPKSSLLFPDVSSLNFTTIEQLRMHLALQVEVIQKQHAVYADLENGKISNDFSIYDFDIDLSDATKINGHKLAAQLCALVNYKIDQIKRQQIEQINDIEEVKQRYGIKTDGVEYDTLLSKTKIKNELLKTRYDSLSKKLRTENGDIDKLLSTLPYLRAEHEQLLVELESLEKTFEEAQTNYTTKYDETLPISIIDNSTVQDLPKLQRAFENVASDYISTYNQIVGKYDETKDNRDIRINEQVSNKTFSFEILEQALLGRKIGALDDVTVHLENLNTELLAIADELLKSLVKVFGKTETFYDKYKRLVDSLNDFFRGKLISNRFFFKIDFDSAPKLDIKWIEYLRKSAHNIASSNTIDDLSPEQFIENFYMKFSGNKTYIPIEELLNPKRYFVLKSKLTDENNRRNSGSSGESYTAIALLGIARLSVVQDGDRTGLRFIILEESAILDNVNFDIFLNIAQEYGYQIITMTPKPYAVGGSEGWFIHQLIPGQKNKDINYAMVMSYFRTNRSQLELKNYLQSRQNNELAIV